MGSKRIPDEEVTLNGRKIKIMKNRVAKRILGQL